jgi:hypothetical protein
MIETPSDRTLDVVVGCLESCRRCEAVVASILEQDPEAFPAVGPHLRHCVDHYRLLLDGWRTGSVDYDARPRDERLERDADAVLDALGEITTSLAALGEDDLERGLAVVQTAAPGRAKRRSPSCLERELVFLSSHTIHHIAIMRLAAREAGVVVPPELAVAFSTESHRDCVDMKV